MATSPVLPKTPVLPKLVGERVKRRIAIDFGLLDIAAVVVPREKRNGDAEADRVLRHAAGKTLELRAERTKVLAANIANESTPGYTARDYDFGAMLQERIDSDSGEPGSDRRRG